MKQTVKLPAYRKNWQYTLYIEGMYNSVCSVELQVLNEYKEEIFNLSSKIAGEDARELLIEFCKKYKVSRDDIFFLHAVTAWMEGTEAVIYIANKDILCM